MNVVASVQNLVYLLLGIAAIGLTGWGFVDALTRKGTLFPHVGRLSKPIWLGILGFAFGIAIVSLAYPIGIINLAGVVAAGVYLGDVRAKLKSIGGGGSRGSQSGPYGPY